MDVDNLKNNFTWEKSLFTSASFQISENMYSPAVPVTNVIGFAPKSLIIPRLGKLAIQSSYSYKRYKSLILHDWVRLCRRNFTFFKKTPVIRIAPNNIYWLISIRRVFFFIVSSCFFNNSTSVWPEELPLFVFDEKNLYLVHPLKHIARNILNSFLTAKFYLKLVNANNNLFFIWIFRQFKISSDSKVLDNQQQSTSALKMRSTRFFSYVVLTFDFLWIRCMLVARIFL